MSNQAAHEPYRPRLAHLSFALATLAALLFTAGAAVAEPAPEEGRALTAHDLVTTLTFNEPLLADLGIEVRNLAPTAVSPAQHPLSVVPADAPAFAAGAPWSLRFEIVDGRFDGFFAGSVRHRGGFELLWDGGAVSLAGFELRPGPEPRTLDLVTSDGLVVLNGSHLHYELDAAGQLLRIFNVDLRISPELAERMERPRLARQAVGVLTLSATVDLPADFDAEGSCPDNWDGDVDVALIDIGDVDQLARSGGQVVMVPSARLKNVGTADVPWYSKFSGDFEPYDNDQHPFLVWSTFRIDDGVIEQLGVSDVKHAFLTINSNCTGCGADSHILGLGCEDVYGTGTNSSNNSLAPREEISPSTGIWAHCDEPVPNTPSHFDQDGNCSQDHFGGGENAFSHGLVVEETDLQDPDAQYVFQAWYVVRKDVDIFNTMGYREIDPDFSGSSWDFPFLTGLIEGSPVDAWVDPGVSDPDATNRTLSSTEGHIQLAARATQVDAETVRIDYALMNHDYDRRIQTLSIPIDPEVVVSATGFADNDADGANDWTATIGADAVVWQAPTDDDAIDWGELFRFTLEAVAVHQAGTATLTPVESGITTEEMIPTLVAGANTSIIFVDGFESGDTTMWSSTTP